MIRPLGADEVAILISAGGAAPSMHNAQPWRFAVVGPVVDVLLDPDRTLPAEDPTGRLTLMGLGAAAFNLRVAAAMLGYTTALVREPDPTRPDIVARLFVELPDVRSELAGLYAEVHRRHTFRGPMADRLLGLVLEAELLDDADPDRLAERARWIGGVRDGDGVPRQALGPLPMDYPAAYRDLEAGMAGGQRQISTFEKAPLVAVLTTAQDGPDEWFRAGQALQRVLLVASSYDVSASFVNQPLEHPEPRRYVRELIGRAGFPQQILRLGHPSGPGARTPRRSWHELQEP